MSQTPIEHKYLIVEIVQVWDEPQPGIAEAVMVDAFKRECHFLDKVPIFTSRDLTPNDIPCSGVIRCVIVEEYTDGTVLIDTYHPDYVESTTEEHLFHVFPSQLTDIEAFS